jgi:hypothetical protein
LRRSAILFPTGLREDDLRDVSQAIGDNGGVSVASSRTIR